MPGSVLSRVLSRDDVEQFIELGHVTLRGAFPRAVATAVRAAMWRILGLREDEPETWTEPSIHLRSNFSGQPFRRAITPRLHAAFDQLLGRGRWLPLTHLGWWPVTFPGFESAPWRPVGDWHVDGGHFHHRLRSSEQGILPLFLFSDIAPGDGGTALVEGSHRLVARVLADHPHGLSMPELSAAVAALPRDAVVEAHGEAGDVVLAHPFLVHARGAHAGPRVRFLCNPCVSLREPLDPFRSVPELMSPVELSIARAFGERGSDLRADSGAGASPPPP